MSQWTHVTGCIRIDNFDVLVDPSFDVPALIKSSFGNTCNYNSSSEDWNNCNVPYGSEGSIQYDIAKTGYSDEHGGSLSWGLVYIWGDLRDFEDVNSIYEWIKQSCENLSIRDCSVTIRVEYQGTYIITERYNEATYKSEFILTKID